MKIKNIDYDFKDETLITRALTHSSYSNEKKGSHLDCNERLEFLGDSVLGLVCAQFLFLEYTTYPEGELSKLRASLVCEQSLFEYAKKIDLGSSLLLGKGEEQTGGRDRASILADAFESVIAAIYLDGGFDKAQQFVLPFLKAAVFNAEKGKMFKDYKTILQEIVQKNPGEKLSYEIVGSKGPDHNKQFAAQVLLNSNIIGRGTGKTKKDAEQLAAKQALELMGK